MLCSAVPSRHLRMDRHQTRLQTHTLRRRERNLLYCTHISAPFCFCFSTTFSLFPISFAFYCLINVHCANGCRLFFTEQSPAHCVCPRRHTLTLKYTLNHENFALGKSPNNLKCTYIGLWLSWSWLLLLYVFCIYVCATWVFTASLWQF